MMSTDFSEDLSAKWNDATIFFFLGGGGVISLQSNWIWKKFLSLFMS